MESIFPISVEPLNDHRLLITFSNNERRIFSLQPYLNDSYFAPLRNLVIFKLVKINQITVEWPGGIDICPDELYYNSKPAGVQ